MSLDERTFQTLVPSRFISFTLPNPFLCQTTSTDHLLLLHTSLLRVAVLDSPSRPTSSPPRTAAMIVPHRRESDWIFSTVAGHLQLILSFGEISRLILIGNLPGVPHPSSYKSPPPSDSDFKSNLEEILMPLLISLTPELVFKNGSQFPEIPFLTYDDGVVRSVVVETCVGTCVGEMLVEDVELEIHDESDVKFTELRRRLRFKRTPNLIQTQITIFPDLNSREIESFVVSGVVNTAVLVQPYLIPMVASISLVSSHLEGKIQSGIRPKALCLGVGGGALLSFLNTRLGFEVVGVEEDEAVLGIARRRFGLPDDPYTRIYIGDGIELMKKLNGTKTSVGLETENGFDSSDFDVIMVDLDSSEAGIGMMAPPMEFVEESVLVATRSVLSKSGIVVVNAIPSSRLSYDGLVHEFKKVFDELYEIDVENGENFVLIAPNTRIGAYSSYCENSFMRRLREAVSGAFLSSIRKI